VSQVFGTPRHPAHTVDRKDGSGLPISIHLRTPDFHTVLFTGPPGMGKTVELDRSEQLAQRDGWVALRVEASRSDMLELRFARRIIDDLDKIRKRYGGGTAKKLEALAKDLIPRAPRGRQHGVEARVGPSPFAQAVFKTQWDAGEQAKVNKTLGELAEVLAEAGMKRKPPEPAFLMIDNVDGTHQRDLDVVIMLSRHLERLERPVFLVMAGGEMATTELMTASGGSSEAATDLINRWDIREVNPFTDAELRPAITVPLDAAQIPYQSEAIDQLVRAANGSPSRLHRLAETALPVALQRGGVTVDVARTAMAVTSDRSRVLHQAAWNKCSLAQQELLVKIAAHGPHGVSLAGGLPGRWQDHDADRQRLVADGVLLDTGDRIMVANPSMQQWIQTRIGQYAATPC
jgi:hypothetical protein